MASQSDILSHSVGNILLKSYLSRTLSYIRHIRRLAFCACSRWISCLWCNNKVQFMLLFMWPRVAQFYLDTLVPSPSFHPPRDMSLRCCWTGLLLLHATAEYTLCHVIRRTSMEHAFHASFTGNGRLMAQLSSPLNAN